VQFWSKSRKGTDLIKLGWGSPRVKKPVWKKVVHRRKRWKFPSTMQVRAPTRKEEEKKSVGPDGRAG